MTAKTNICPSQIFLERTLELIEFQQNETVKQIVCDCVPEN